MGTKGMGRMLRILMKTWIAITVYSLFFPIAFAAEGKFKVDLISVARNDEAFIWTIRVKCVADDFDTYYVHKPDEWGKAKFYCSYNNKSIESTNELLVSPLEYTGILCKRGDELTFKYTAVAKDGFLVFSETGEKLPIFSRNPKLKVSLNLWISNFSNGKCGIEYPESDWVTTDFPFGLSKPPALAPAK